MQVLNPSAVYRELSRLSRKIPGVRSPGKQVSPAARVPKRVLVQIFQEVCNARAEDHLEKCDWPVVGHVCRSWRAAAFDIPRLWANGSLFSLKKTNFGLGPSGYSATLYMDRDAKWMEIHRERLIQLIFGDCDRMKRLILDGAQVCSFMQNANKPASQLWDLVLDSNNPRKHRIFGSKKRSYVLPPDVFQGHCPALFHLSLTNIIIDMNSHLLSTHLHSLTLSRTDERCPRLCSLPQFLEVLSSMLLLTHLTVEDILTDPEDEVSLDRSLGQLSPVYLLALENLRITLPSPQNYSGLLNKLQLYAGSVRCALSTTIDTSRIQDFQMLPRDLQTGEPPDMRFEQLVLRIKKAQELSFCASGRAGSVNFKVEDSPTFTSLLYLCFYLRKPLSTVQNVILGSGLHIDGQWPLFWEYLSGVKDLYVMSCDIPSLMDALARPDVFPKLEQLEFPNLWDYPTDFFIILADALDKRLHGGLSLELVVWNMGVKEVIPCQTPKDLANLRQRSGPNAKK